MDLSHFLECLHRVIHWTRQRALASEEIGNYGTLFRQFNPMVDDRPLYTLDQGYATWNVDPYNVTYFAQALHLALQQRTQLMGQLIAPITDLSSLGRVLCFSTLLTTHDGIAIAESNCFVDESDVPPIDTWFYLENHFLDVERPTLFCWIPKPFEYLIEVAMRVEMMGSYKWLDTVAPRFYAQLLLRLLNT
ncbi:hypothetical protein MTX78_23950 (plasmid) [Hymenobacter tibetensis]|uniref:Uncharacterized protein n=1 Tax=Hymenobacter tibetensis TaxID=497967 RepID=A0ABY4D723_9BACT|nr:hypothetical protein [Hymenobacter tibetensis]UOG77400.1 hypothetical protein MTX78_23950 [Hymenobacter tibetensis]